MEISRSSCRLCLSESEFNIPLFGSFCRRTNMLDKIFVCLKITIEESDIPEKICYKCANTIESYYDFATSIKKSQTKLGCREVYNRQGKLADDARSSNSVNKRHVTSYVREQVYDADYTFSFLDVSNIEEKREVKASSPFFSYFSPPDNSMKKPSEPTVWKTPRSRCNTPTVKAKRGNGCKKQCSSERGRQYSSDLFESQSQDGDAELPANFDWRLIPDNNIIKIVKEKCFGRSDF